METEGPDNEPPEVLRKQGRRCFRVEDQLTLGDRVYPKVAFLFCLPFDSECRGRHSRVIGLTGPRTRDSSKLRTSLRHGVTGFRTGPANASSSSAWENRKCPCPPPDSGQPGAHPHLTAAPFPRFPISNRGAFPRKRTPETRLPRHRRPPQAPSARLLAKPP